MTKETCLSNCAEIMNLFNQLGRDAFEAHDVDLINQLWYAMDRLADIRSFVEEVEEVEEPDYDAAREWDDEDEDGEYDEDEEDSYTVLRHGFNALRENP